MLSLEAGQKLLGERVAPLSAVEVTLAGAIGLRVADVPRALLDLPASNVSVMDGYACRAEDLKAGHALPVAFEVPAGRVPNALPKGTAARIFTGAMVPQGADTVVPQEDATRQDDGTVRLAPIASGRFIRRKGELCLAGASLAAPGDVLTPQRAALLASAGVSTVRVTPQPRLALISTGSELVAVGQTPGPGQICDSNGMMLEALATGAGLAVVSSERAVDEAGPLRSALDRATGLADIVITTGGVSVGDYDLVPAALADVGAETLFHRLAIKPGKPLLAALSEKAIFVGLPGNPLSAFVCWRMFVLPLSRALAGDEHAFNEVPEQAVLAAATVNKGKRLMLAPAVLANGQATVLSGKGSHDLVSLAQANALAVLGIGAQLAAGDAVACYRL